MWKETLLSYILNHPVPILIFKSICLIENIQAWKAAQWHSACLQAGSLEFDSWLVYTNNCYLLVT